MRVLGNGYINLISHMGDDLTVVNAARKSFARESNEFDEKDKKLLNYLWNNKHTSPFEMVEFMFEVKAPLFVIRQWQRHRTWSYNEVSRRYTSEKLDFYVPSDLRSQSQINKQSSDTRLNEEDNSLSIDAIEEHIGICLKIYDSLIKLNVCREQARMVLPQNMMVEMVAKTDLHNLIHFLRLRLHKHAQWEIQEYARAIVKLIEPVVPETIKLVYRDIGDQTCQD